MSSIHITGSKVVDLSHPFEADMPLVSDFPALKKEMLFSHDTGSDFNAELLTFCPHIGTHLDAPWHWIRGGKKVDELAADCLIGPAYVVDLHQLKGSVPITDQDIKTFEEKSGEAIQPGDAVLFWTGQDKLWRDKAQFLQGWPYMTREGAEYLVSKQIRLIGMETLNIDAVDKPESPAHKTLLSNDILIVENLTNLDQIGAVRCSLVGTLINIVGASGCPVRMIAVL
jgi:kynurenine formamidase